MKDENATYIRYTSNSMKQVILFICLFILRCAIEYLFYKLSIAGFDFIVEPEGFLANYCVGECIHFEGDNPEYKSLSDRFTMKLCCVPVKYESIDVLYMLASKELKRKQIPNLRVAECGCLPLSSAFSASNLTTII